MGLETVFMGSGGYG